MNNRRFTAAVLTAVMIISSAYSTSLAASSGWKQQDGTWVYVLGNGSNATGWKKVGNKWYYFDDEGLMQTGIISVDGSYYYLAPSGEMKTGWQKDGEGVWHYCKSSGAAVASAWRKIGGKWYYFDAGSSMVTGINEIGGKLYNFKSSGELMTGWQKTDPGAYYYFTENGALTGWNKIDNVWYYFFEDTCLTAVDVNRIDGEVYIFSSGGAMLKSGWRSDASGRWYYLKSSGEAYKGGEYTIGDNKFLFDEDGAFVSEEKDTKTLNNSVLTDPYAKTNTGLVEWAKNAYKMKWGYVWGGYGRMLTPDYFGRLCIQYPDNVANYYDYIRKNYIGRRVVDCNGLIKGYQWYDPDRQEVIYGFGGAPDIGANTQYNSAAVKGDIKTMPEIPGLGVWKKGHVGIYIGGGYVIEAKGTKYGVVMTKLKGSTFTNWFKINGISYPEE